MLRRGQAFVRARTPSGRWVSADILDLDELSFRAFVLEKLCELGAVCYLKDEICEGEEIFYKTKYEITEFPDDKAEGGVK